MRKIVVSASEGKPVDECQTLAFKAFSGFHAKEKAAVYADKLHKNGLVVEVIVEKR